MFVCVVMSVCMCVFVFPSEHEDTKTVQVEELAGKDMAVCKGGGTMDFAISQRANRQQNAHDGSCVNKKSLLGKLSGILSWFCDLKLKGRVCTNTIHPGYTFVLVSIK